MPASLLPAPRAAPAPPFALLVPPEHAAVAAPTIVMSASSRIVPKPGCEEQSPCRTDIQREIPGRHDANALDLAHLAQISTHTGSLTPATSGTHCAPHRACARWGRFTVQSEHSAPRCYSLLLAAMGTLPAVPERVILRAIRMRQRPAAAATETSRLAAVAGVPRLVLAEVIRAPDLMHARPCRRVAEATQV